MVITLLHKWGCNTGTKYNKDLIKKKKNNITNVTNITERITLIIVIVIIIVVLRSKDNVRINLILSI